MNDSDRLWVDTQLDRLTTPLTRHLRGAWSFFVPSDTFHGLLESGIDDELQRATDQLGAHVGLSIAPLVTYELGLRLPLDTAGQIAQQRGRRSRIEIPLFYVGKPLPLGAILAHELTHEVLHNCGVAGNDPQETERLTDLASIALGLGALVLNGMIVADRMRTVETQVLGYLRPAVKAYAVFRVARTYRVPRDTIMACLTPDAAAMVDGLPTAQAWG